MKNRRTAFMVIGITLVGIAIAALPQLGLAQSSPLIGTWKLNLEKSKFVGSPLPRSQTLTYQQDGQNIRNTSQGIDAQSRSASPASLPSPLGGPERRIASISATSDGPTRFRSRKRNMTACERRPARRLVLPYPHRFCCAPTR